VPGVTAPECPVSYITPRSLELLNLVRKAADAFQASGASLFGPDLSKWPPWAADAVIEIERQTRAAEHYCAQRERLER